MRNPAIRQSSSVDVDAEIIAQNIVKLAEIGDALTRSRLTRKAITILIVGITKGITRKQIEVILDALPKLKSEYIKEVE